MTGFRIINSADKIDGSKDWNFLKDQMQNLEAEWDFFINYPTNWLEKRITKPPLSRYRTCLQAVLHAKRRKATHFISHLPRATSWSVLFAHLFQVKTPHLAFSFTFTDLPTGFKRKLMAYAFQFVDRFVVYSTVEKLLYADYFKLDPNRFDVLPWAMEKPEYAPAEPLIAGDYICAVGSEGRDYATLVEAMRELPHISLVIVARPYNLEGLTFPPNVQVFTELPVQNFWNVVRFSRFTVLPLRDRKTNCSHISIVGSMLFGKPLVVTESEGTTDYLVEDQNALVSDPGNSAAMGQNIDRLWRDRELCDRMIQEADRIAKSKHQLDSWARYLDDYLQHTQA
jgi:glycosyltransferase involved in cell wall biosynthesis